MENKNSIRRRTVIKTIGALSAVSIGTVSVVADDSDNIRERVNDHLLEGDLDAAIDIIEDEDVEYTLETGKLEINKDEDGSEEDDEISPDNRYSETESELNMLLFEGSHNDSIFASLQVTLDGEVTRFRDARTIDDAIGISFNDDHWSVIGTPTVAATDPHEADWFSQSLEDGGLAGEVDISGNKLEPDKTVLLETHLQNLDGVPGTIFGAYSHTTAAYSGSIEEISGGAGAINVTISSGNIAWELAEPADPDGLF